MATAMQAVDASARAIHQYNSVLNAVITSTIEPARATAVVQDSNVVEREPSLRGVTIALKDNIDLRGVRTTGGSPLYADRVATSDAFVTDRLRRAGALIVAKTNLDELAFGAVAHNPYLGSCKNCWNLERVPGGSSGGSAVAVASGMAMASLGTDTGGSIRIPAAFTGLVGLRPTLGRISNRGVLPVSPSFDTVGPLARTVDDVLRVLRVIDAFDPLDPTCLPGSRFPIPAHFECESRIFRVGVVASMCDGAESSINAATHDMAEILSQNGCEVEEIELDGALDIQDMMTRISFPEMASRFEQSLASTPDLFSEQIRRRIQLGLEVDACDMARAVGWRREWQRRLERVFDAFDVLLAPTVPVDAPSSRGPEVVSATRELTRFTNAFSMFTGPSLSIPCGVHPVSGVPIGAQLVAAPWDETTLCRVARRYERVRPWPVPRAATQRSVPRLGLEEWQSCNDHPSI